MSTQSEHLVPENAIKKAILIREFEKKILSLYAEGRIAGTVHTCIGQEFTPIEVSARLTDRDYVVSNHRGHGHYLALTGDYIGLMSEILGKTRGCSGGMGGSQHLVAHNFMSNGIQGGMLPIGAGIAMALNREQNIVVAFIGDGTFGEGIVYETFNIASLWGAPLLVVVENNRIAQSTAIEQNTSGSIRGRAAAFDIGYALVDATIYTELSNAVEECIRYVRMNRKPFVLEVISNRLMSHSKGDDNRDTTKVTKMWEADPITIYSNLYPESYKKFLDETTEFLNSTVTEALSASNYTGIKSCQVNEQYQTIPVLDGDPQESDQLINGEIRSALEELLSSNQDIYLIGEDIESSNRFNPGAYGGAFKVTGDLSVKFPNRVLNTPISEAAITGVGIGMALAGRRPIVEIMFGDFLTLAFDQIMQHASKIAGMYGAPRPVPLVIRTPMGGGRGYGPTHSQSIEKHFLGIQHVDVVAINHRLALKGFYKEVIENVTNLTIIIENKRLYALRTNAGSLWPYRLFQTTGKFPTINIKINDPKIIPDITIICYGYSLWIAEQAMVRLLAEYEIVCELICPSLISNTELSLIEDSVKVTSNVLSIEEGSGRFSWSSDCVSRMVQRGTKITNHVAISNESIIPAQIDAELDLLPNVDAIVNAALRIIQER
jgi:2-oxoisovalerate dehydrogenase E1 component